MVVAGFSLFVVSVYTIVRFGKGWPMNAFPPPEFTARGPYSFFSHPIYLGFCLSVFGLSALFGTSSGFYLVAPMVTLGCVSLVLGYENPAMEKRFPALRYEPFIGFIPAARQVPLRGDRVKAWLFLLLLAVFLVAIGLSWNNGVAGAENTVLLIPVLVLVPAVLLSGSAFSDIQVRVLQTGAGILLAFAFSALLQRNLGFLGITCLAVILARNNRLPAVVIGVAITALIFSFGLMETAVLPLEGVVLAGGLGAPLLLRAGLTLAEKAANSWRAWELGPVRLINHGLYAG
ncbi:MAG: phosphatidylethanolamine N-methyltransferase family protein, partial [Deltaproteobacteria bacterium]|nr:phosphatidylethanolamine N-methyltransferase family protein [Deltaproteobacteria bacterium]